MEEIKYTTRHRVVSGFSSGMASAVLVLSLLILAFPTKLQAFFYVGEFQSEFTDFRLFTLALFVALVGGCLVGLSKFRKPVKLQVRLSIRAMLVFATLIGTVTWLLLPFNPKLGYSLEESTVLSDDGITYDRIEVQIANLGRAPIWYPCHDHELTDFEIVCNGRRTRKSSSRPRTWERLDQNCKCILATSDEPNRDREMRVKVKCMDWRGRLSEGWSPLLPIR